jgi:hypothetical protein
MDQCKSSTVPMQQNVKLFCDDGSKEMNRTVYRQMVGSLNYLTTTRPDIAYFVSVLSQFMAKPHEIYWNAAKAVYLKGTLDYGIKYTVAYDVELTVTQILIGLTIWMIEDQPLDPGLFNGPVKPIVSLSSIEA